MITFLRLFFGVVLLSMLAVTSWASLECALWKTPREVVTHPWFIATLFDTYWAFLTFYCWVAYKETSWLARIAWLLGILLLGSIVMAISCSTSSSKCLRMAKSKTCFCGGGPLDHAHRRAHPLCAVFRHGLDA